MRVVRVHYFAGVGRADRAHRVRIIDSSFHEIYATAVLYAHILGVGYAEHVLYNTAAVFALILYVVYRKHHLDAAVALAIHVKQLVVNGHESGLPIVAMYYIGLKAEVRNKLRNRAGKESKSLTVVVISV